MQIALFDLATPDAQQRRPDKRRQKKPEKRPQQMGFVFRARHDDPEDTDWDYPEHTRTKASETQAPKVRSPSSVFDLAACPVRVKMAQTTPDKCSSIKVERDSGMVKLTRIAVQETDEWIERERIRRAKQKPPKPSQAAKTTSQKLRALIE